MKTFIDYLERRIEGCDCLGGLQKEKAVYQSVLKEYRKQCDIPVVSGSLQSLQEWAKSVKDGQVEQIIVMTAFGNTIVVDLTSKNSIEEFCEWQ